ncbi:hypothetical protein ACGFIE_17835 [Micromonospora sp. NPDC049275]
MTNDVARGWRTSPARVAVRLRGPALPARGARGTSGDTRNGKYAG